MSLDVTLRIRLTHCECCGQKLPEDNEAVTKRVFDSNITHNLGKMADAAGIYKACWRPEELGITRAAELIPLLGEGIRRLNSEPDHFRKFDASNGWGTYDQFVPWVVEYFTACAEWPDATVEVSR